MKIFIKKTLPITIAVIFVIATILSFKHLVVEDLNINKKVKNNKSTNFENWYAVKQVADKVWCIDDHGGDNMYLVEGRDSALLIDTGTGVANLDSIVKTLTKLPVIVVNTHGHPDHSGGNFQYEKIYAQPLDFELIDLFTSKTFFGSAIENAARENPELTPCINKKTDHNQNFKKIPIKEGYVFDLGNRKLEVIEVPGHTKGSICLPDAKNKLIFTGDNNNTLVWMFLDRSLPLESYIGTLQKLKRRSNNFDSIYPGHGGPLEITFIDELITCAQNILDGKCKGEKYETFVDYALVCGYKRAQIAYNPDNLRVKE